MSGQTAGTRDVPEDAGPALQAGIEALRAAGADRADPVRFRFIEALADRLRDQPEPVRRLLHERLRTALAACGDRLPATPGAPATDRSSAVAERNRHVAADPLAQLNAHLRTLRPDADAGLASAGRFRHAWSRLRAGEQVDQAIARRPAHAGPINSHVLVLQSLDLMRALSPDYLRAFLRHVEALQWLEQAQARPPKKAAAPRQRKRPAPP